jgi:hypothetical protein
MSKLDKAQKGLAGEYYVLAQFFCHLVMIRTRITDGIVIAISQ